MWETVSTYGSTETAFKSSSIKIPIELITMKFLTFELFEGEVEKFDRVFTTDFTLSFFVEDRLERFPPCLTFFDFLVRCVYISIILREGIPIEKMTLSAPRMSIVNRRALVLKLPDVVTKIFFNQHTPKDGIRYGNNNHTSSA
jgi:hypothetical protein